ncbi:MAG: alkyldihydroxyacetonephosphate synthase [Solirubrobacteraceae bacterium]|nr:alkyldihydroxyacetonephosphate synthase [Solirubrobacteraceae bacterium]
MGPEMRWWGWGEDAHAGHGSAAALAWVERELGPLDAPRGPVALEDVRLGDSALPGGLRERFAEILRDDRAARVLHARGKSYPDLVRQRAGDCADAPDAVLVPRDHDEVRAVVAACASAGVAVVPFGGGTSVVGGLEPLREGFSALVSLDLGALDAVESVDERSQVAVVGGGIRAPELEAQLAARGLMVGHRPQSFEYVSIGGCVATRSAGQSSTGYGRIDDLVVGARLAAPAGDLDLAAQPASAAGPDLRRLVIGSEGTLGAITRVALRVRPTPAVTRYEGWMFPSFGAGAEVLRRLRQEGMAPTVARLSDEDETRMGVGMAGLDRPREAALRGYLRLRGVGSGALAVLGWEGAEDRVRGERDAAVELVREGGAIALGRAPGRAWLRSRFHGPYLRDELMARGVMVETLETATTWARLFDLYREVGATLRRHAPIVGCHVSHLYPTGASLYFTFMARAERGRELEQWARVKHEASEAIVAAGATITHHHAVGRDHAPYLGAEVGDVGLAALRALKAELDPAGVMNPGKLLPRA